MKTDLKPGGVERTSGKSRPSWRESVRDCARLVAGAVLLGLAACQSTPPPPIDYVSMLEAQAFVRQTFVHGVPYPIARRIDPRVVPVLWEMLADPLEEPHWPNIVVLLAIIGDEAATERLMAFVHSDSAVELSPAQYAAKTAALMALGYHVNHTGNPACLDYLAECAHPAYWRTLDLRWRAPFPQSIEERNAQLATLAVLGLALSGAPEAERRLETLRQVCDTPEGAELRATVGNVLEEAISACQTIQEIGLSEYCRQSHH